jgi:hypothetical protein
VFAREAQRLSCAGNPIHAIRRLLTARTTALRSSCFRGAHTHWQARPEQLHDIRSRLHGKVHAQRAAQSLAI